MPTAVEHHTNKEISNIYTHQESVSHAQSLLVNAITILFEKNIYISRLHAFVI